MIKYQLICEKEHEFEGWFQSSDAFSEQCAAGFLSCPICETVNVRRALMAPNLASPKTRKTEVLAEQSAKAAAVSPPPPVSVSDAGMPPEAMVKMRELVVEMRALQSRIKRECRDVGSDFAEEARKIHYGETDERDIYGQTTADEARDLLEEGVPVAPLPGLTEKQKK